LNVLVFGLDWAVDGVVDESGVGVGVWVKADSVVFNMWWVLNGVVDASVYTFLDLESSSVTFVLAWSESVPLALSQRINLRFVTSFDTWCFVATTQFSSTRVLHTSSLSTNTAFASWVWDLDSNQLRKHTARNSFHF
jgi:hypothetical protein